MHSITQLTWQKQFKHSYTFVFQGVDNNNGNTGFENLYWNKKLLDKFLLGNYNMTGPIS